MTVRAWFTISGLVLVALVAAVVFKLLAPVSPPKVFARVGTTRLSGELDKACWPRGNTLRCTNDDARPASSVIPSSGKLHVVVGFPVQPKVGSIRISTKSGLVVKKSKWRGDFAYDLKPGRYVLRADARFGNGVFVVYDFAFSVSRSGS